METKTLGLDLSLTGTGFCLLSGSEMTVETIKTTPKTAVNDLARLVYIRDYIMKRIPQDIDLICVEDFFTPMNGAQMGSAISLAMLGTAVRMALYEEGLPFFVVAPGTLKKHILGKGVGQKDLIVREVYKKYGLDAADNNQADACVLAHIAEDLYRTIKGEHLKLSKPQEDVIAKLLSTKDERGYNVPIIIPQ